MNHAKPFWKTLGEFKAHFNTLVQSGYTGEGFWSRGRKMDNMGTSVSGLGMQSVDLPQALCGGAHRRFKKAASFKKFIIKARKTRSERFIEKAGSNGTLLGAEFEVRKNLDRGKKPKGAPRVVQSKRGKDLRLNAALARFEQAKSMKSEKNLTVKNEPESFTVKNESENFTVKNESESIAVKNEAEGLKINNETLQEKNDNHEQEDEEQDQEVQVLDFDQNDFEYGHLYQDEDEDIKTILKQEYEEIFGTTSTNIIVID
jgi:DNA-dependent metalloprotease WSS1